MDEKELKERTKKFALRTIRLVEAMPKSQAANVIGNQLIRSATSVAERIIVLRVVPGQNQILQTRWVCWSKRQMNHISGLS